MHKAVQPAMEFLPMRAGDGKDSYFQNSNYQRLGANSVTEKIEEEIAKINVTWTSKTIRIADLGCATGPNTFIAMQNAVEAIKRKRCPINDSELLPEFQVFFSDRTSNDFNTLFNSLPGNRDYFAASVPGSFHGRLFPESGLHFVYSAYALHWLSELPESLLDSNKGRIHYLNAPKEVSNLYVSRFHMDIGDFLDARAKEIVEGGVMVILIIGRPNEVQPHCHISSLSLEVDFIGSIFMEMAKEGLISEALVDSFNIPIYAASAEEMTNLVKKNGCFEIERIEFTRSALESVVTDISVRINHCKAGIEGMLSKHFGTEITDQMFQRLHQKLKHNSHVLTSAIEASGQLFISLKRI